MADYVYVLNEYGSLLICRNWTKKMAAINVGEMSNFRYCILSPSTKSYITCVFSEFVFSKCSSRALIRNSRTAEVLRVHTTVTFASYQILTLSTLPPRHW